MRDAQVLRGMCQRWLVSNWFCEICLQTIDVLLARADEDSSYVTCVDGDVWASFWTLLEVLRVTASAEQRWKSLFTGTLDRLLTIEKRFSGPRGDIKSLWITSDATLRKMGALNWKEKEYLDLTLKDVAKPFLGDEDYDPIIAEAELAIECLGFVTWTPIDQGKVVTFLGGDNTNAFCWISNGKAEIGLGRDILAGFQLYVAIRALEPHPFYMRTHRNITADFITRASSEEIELWKADEGFTRAPIPWWWEEVARLPQLFNWNGWFPNNAPLRILKRENPLILVEWRGAAFTATSVWRRMGKLARITHCRVPAVEKLLSIRQAQVWTNEQVDLLVGTAWNVLEVGEFQTEISRLQPRCAVLITPSHLYEFKDLPLNWTAHFWVDGACAGDLVGGCWNVSSVVKKV